MTVRPATYDDIPVMDALYGQARGIMRSDHNFEQWAGPYPNAESARKDIDLGHAFIIEGDGGEALGTFAFIPGEEPTYREIFEGQWLDDEAPYATIHRLSSGPQSHGIAHTCFEWCASRCPNLRIDTHRDNSIMQHVILDFGFIYCGIIFLADGSERLAYQMPVPADSQQK